MENNWFISVNGQVYGPYQIFQVTLMLEKGEITPATYVYHASLGNWTPALEVKSLWKKKKKKRPAFKIALSILLIAALIFSGFMIIELNKPKMLELGKSNKTGSFKVGSEGSTINANGLIIEIPEEAYEKNVKFSISEREIISNQFGEHFSAASPLYEINNGGVISDEPLTVTIPVSIQADEFAMAFYYTKKGKLEALPLLYQDTEKIVIATTHFSNIITSRIKIDSLYNISIDSGFMPGIDDWSFANYGSQISTGGFCAGQSASMAYYFSELKPIKGQGLFSKYDNNSFGVKTPQFQWDDSLGIRLASVVQESGAWSSIYFKVITEYVNRELYLSDRTIYMAVAYAMLLTGEPQLLGIFVRTVTASKKITLKAGHAILAYKIDANKIYVSDPNFPGDHTLSIPFNVDKFGIYVSKTEAGKPDIHYNSFALVGKSALFNWSSIGHLFNDMDKHSLDSKIGNSQFSYCDFYVISDVTSDKKEVKDIRNPKEFIYDEASKNRIREHFKTHPMAPFDWEDKDYLVLNFSVEAKNDGYLQAYNGTIYLMDSIASGSDYDTVFIPLESGTNDIGLGFFDQKTEYIGFDAIEENDFVHFHRVKIINGEEDFTGNWDGEYRILEAENFIRLARKIGPVIYKAIHRFFNSIFKSDDELPSDEEIADKIEETIRGDEDFFASKPFKVRMEQIDKENYNIWVTIPGDDDELPTEYNLQSKYKNGRLEFSIPLNDRQSAVFLYKLHDNKTFAGEFQIKLGIIKLATGETKLEKAN